MTTPATIVTAILSTGLLALGYWNWQLYQANTRQAAQIAELTEQAHAVENVRADVMAQVEEALGAGAAQLMAAAEQVEGRIDTLEDDLDNTRNRLDTTEADVEALWDYTTWIDQLRSRVQTLENCVDYLYAGYGFASSCY